MPAQITDRIADLEASLAHSSQVCYHGRIRARRSVGLEFNAEELYELTPRTVLLSCSSFAWSFTTKRSQVRLSLCILFMFLADLVAVQFDPDIDFVCTV